MSTPPFPDMDELLQRLLDDQIEPDEMQRLEKAIREDPRVRDYYLDSMLVCAVIRRSSQVTGELSKSDLIRAISSGTGQGGSKRLGRRFLSIAAILLLGVLVLASLYLFRHKAQGPAIGTLAGVYEAQWRGSHPRPGEPLYVGRLRSARGCGEDGSGPGDEPPARSSLPGRTEERRGSDPEKRQACRRGPSAGHGFSSANTHGSHHGLGHGIWGDRPFRREHRGPCSERPHHRSSRSEQIGSADIARCE